MKDPFDYQVGLMVGMRMFEEWLKYEDQSNFLEYIFAITQPAAHAKYKKKKDFFREEEGVDEVIYSGEDDWEEISETLEEFGFAKVDVFGKGLEDG